MKFSGVLSIFAITAATASAFYFDLPADQKPVASDQRDIPGDSPVKLCSLKPEEDTVVIKEVNIAPNPPAPGQNLLINATGEVIETIEDGAYIHVIVKVGKYIKLLEKNFDFCEQIANVNLSCPLEPGPVHVTKDVDLPSQIPPGKFFVTALLYTVDDDPITCLEAEVDFSKH